MENKYFIHEIKGKDGIISNKGIVVADTFDDARQGYHAYLGAYAYGHDTESDFVSCMITDMNGLTLMQETWLANDVEV